ncbi:MAG: DUF1351 domain-containing protein [Clostridia bacterium]|nr:DUF1351 domain-containing protein [Clostridia bacterium]
MENQELMVVKQLPIIEERFKQLSEKVDEKVKNAEALVCTEENVKVVKQVRADLNKEYRDVETQRKKIKEQVLAPYMQFEEVYKQYIADKYKNADLILGGKVKVIEDDLKAKKEQEIKDYFEELKTANNIDFVTYEQAKINVTLTASKKSLREQVENFINKILDDLKLIETQEHKAEILVEYKQSLNASNAITTVLNRVEAIKNEEKKQEEKVVHIEMNENHEITKESYEQLEEVFTPKQEKLYTIPFKATGTSVQLKMLKDFMEREGIRYESVTSNK